MEKQIANNAALYDIPLISIDGRETSLKEYTGQVLLIVNVATRCGFTPQYAALEKMYRELNPQGFSILGFPCDQFLHQEPGSNQEIQAFAHSCYNITFPLFAKTFVKGPQQSPLYKYLAKNIKKKPIKFIPWNFTKILVDANGAVLKRYLPTTSLKKIKQEVVGLLEKN